MHRVGNIVNNVVITLAKDKNHFTMCINVKSLSCTPETNIILYISYTSVKINK